MLTDILGGAALFVASMTFILWFVALTLDWRPHRHAWEVTSVCDVWEKKPSIIVYTDVGYQCSGCGKPKSIRMTGRYRPKGWE